MAISMGGKTLSHFGNSAIQAVDESNAPIARVYAGDTLVWPDMPIVIKGYGEVTEEVAYRQDRLWWGTITKKYVFALSRCDWAGFSASESYNDVIGLASAGGTITPATDRYEFTPTGNLYDIKTSYFWGYANLSHVEAIVHYEFDIEMDGLENAYPDLAAKIASLDNAYLYSYADYDEQKTPTTASPYGSYRPYASSPDWFYLDVDGDVMIRTNGSISPSWQSPFVYYVGPKVTGNDMFFCLGLIPITRCIYSNAGPEPTTIPSRFEITEEAPDEMRHVSLTDFFDE